MTDVQLEGVTPLLDSSSLKVENSTNNNQNGLETEVEEAEDDTPCIDIIINNVVCTFSTRCHLNLRTVAMEGANVEYKREQGMCNMRIRRPYTTASIWSSGKITCTGATSEPYAKIAARKFARQLQRIGFDVKFSNFKVVNVLGTCSMPFKIKVADMARKYPREVSYEPELHPGATYRIKEPKATLKIFTTGSITVTAPCVDNVQSAIEHIFPLVAEFKAVKSEVNAELLMKEARFIQKHRVIKPKRPITKFEEDLEYEDSSDEDFDSEEDQD
ncbi:TBP [Mytilus coruscus]|uniref:TATA box-binding protein-like 1 n=1 Tax=Mytilus coruscus TaxID=42192 RepID=A0A6J8DJ61_MYTCO|nr:TBP [Mytilus coruscus]